MAARIIDKKCPGNCAVCTIGEDDPNFNYYSCVLHQIFQKQQRIERTVEELKSFISEKEITVTHADNAEQFNNVI